MSGKDETVSQLVTLLNRIVGLWPTSSVDDMAATRESLKDYLASGFESIDLSNHIQSVGAIDRTEIGPHGAVMYFYDGSENLQRAIFQGSPTVGWKLLSLRFQCPVCFGTGENNGATCEICGGKGWGVS